MYELSMVLLISTILATLQSEDLGENSQISIIHQHQKGLVTASLERFLMVLIGFIVYKLYKKYASKNANLYQITTSTILYLTYQTMCFSSLIYQYFNTYKSRIAPIETIE